MSPRCPSVVIPAQAGIHCAAGIPSSPRGSGISFVTPRLDRGAQVIRSRRAATQIHCATVTHACRNVALTCAYAVFQNDPELCGSNNNTCLENISAMFYQSLLCPDNSVYDPNAPDNASTASGYVNGKCKCIDGFTPANGQCLEQCQEVGQIRNASGVCQCDTANGWILSGDNCVCNSAMGYQQFGDTLCVSVNTPCKNRTVEDACRSLASPNGLVCIWDNDICVDPYITPCEERRSNTVCTARTPDYECAWSSTLNRCIDDGKSCSTRNSEGECEVQNPQTNEQKCLWDDFGTRHVCVDTPTDTQCSTCSGLKDRAQCNYCPDCLWDDKGNTGCGVLSDFCENIDDADECRNNADNGCRWSAGNPGHCYYEKGS